MTFGEKLFNLRKENGLSQEALAEKLNTTRQAVSRWENNQGYPETEKLLLISNIFKLSLDSLLKNNSDNIISEEKGYYVSMECAEDFLMYSKKVTQGIALGIWILIMAGVPYFLFEPNTILSITLSSLVIVIGIGILIATSFNENHYKILKRERLTFDHTYTKVLKSKYYLQKNKYIGLIIFAIALIFIGGVLSIIVEETPNCSLPLDELSCIIVASAVYCFVYVIGISDSYNILLKNEEYMDKLHFRFLRKLRKKLGD